MTNLNPFRICLPHFLPTAVVATLVVLAPNPARATGELLWSDEFNVGSVPDPAHWSHDLGTGMNGWGNWELQEYTDSPANAAIENGNLVITARQSEVAGNVVGFTSARIRSQDKLMVKYGQIEARIKVPDLERGLWPAFWTLGQDFSVVGWPAAGELDILEMGGLESITAGEVNRTVSSTAHWENQGSRVSWGHPQGIKVVAESDLNDDFHLFTMNWTPSLVTTYLDGQKIWEFDITPGNCTDCTEFHQPHFLILNLAVGGTFTGMRDITAVTAPLPATLLVDYVRIYDNGFTELSGPALGAPDIGPAHSGSWYNADQSGHGLSVEFGELPDGTPLAVIYWYTWDDQGNNVFLLGTGIPEGNRVEVHFEAVVGMEYAVFDPTTVTREDGGTGVFEFSDRGRGVFSYAPSEFTASNYGHLAGIAELPLVKLFGIPANLAFSGAARR